ncbi:MAG: trypsin-like peptidase domain-containing protein [Gemmatimonadaceae bacterium]
MAVELRITKGARAGAKERFDKSVVAIGRHPINDLRFDVERDLDVSSRHAELRTVGDRHLLVDLGSTNGTFVNGQRVAGERALFDGDVVTFGANGPQAEFRVVSADAVATAGAAAAIAPAPPPRRPTAARIAEAVELQTTSLKRMVLGLAAVVITGAIVAVWVNRNSAAETRAQLSMLLAANDSLASALTARLTETGNADSAIKALRAESDGGARALGADAARGGDGAALSARMRDAQARVTVLSQMDFTAIAEANQAAIAFLVVEMPDGVRSSGTGFNVAPGGLIVTNRHVVQTPDGTRAERIAVAFDGTSRRWLQATIEYVSESDELALLRLVRSGPWPVVAGVAESGADTRVGAPVGVLGYPLGTGTVGMDGDINALRPVATLGVGTVSKALAETLQLDAFAAQGSSGSPVFDARGYVIGVIYGGADESGGRIVYAVPSARLAAQLPADVRGILR